MPEQALTPEQRRRRYLAAMGVVGWRLRDAGEGAPAAAAPALEAGAAALSSSGDAPGAEFAELPHAERADTSAAPATAGEADGAEAAERLEALRRQVAQCRACPLHETRTQTVFGVGSPRARCMFVGEAPGADEDRRGEPFVGRAGQLLNAMLAAIELAREDVFIANILKCRPPRNRDPHAEEVDCCSGFLRAQVGLIQPRILVAVGRVAAQNLLGSKQSLGRLRGRLHEHPGTGLPVLVTYHPAYLLRTPTDKAKAWADLRRLRSILAEPR